MITTQNTPITGEYQSGEDDHLDAAIKPWVDLLRTHGIETFESCQGGTGHTFPEPTIRFHGGRAEGLRALAVAQQNNLPVACLRRYWQVDDGEPTGPWWELVFTPQF